MFNAMHDDDTPTLRQYLNEVCGVPIEDLDAVPTNEATNSCLDARSTILHPTLRLLGAFKWDHTPQGHDFWQELDRQIGQHGRVQDLPDASMVWEDDSPTQGDTQDTQDTQDAH